MLGPASAPQGLSDLGLHRNGAHIILGSFKLLVTGVRVSGI
jgi:hypothetical protein